MYTLCHSYIFRNCFNFCHSTTLSHRKRVLKHPINMTSNSSFVRPEKFHPYGASKFSSLKSPRKTVKVDLRPCQGSPSPSGASSISGWRPPWSSSSPPSSSPTLLAGLSPCNFHCNYPDLPLFNVQGLLEPPNRHTFSYGRLLSQHGEIDDEMW